MGPIDDLSDLYDADLSDFPDSRPLNIHNDAPPRYPEPEDVDINEAWLRVYAAEADYREDVLMYGTEEYAQFMRSLGL